MDEDWSELLGDLLFSITNNLKNLEYIRFGAVCFEWRSFCIQNYEHIKIPSNLPLLLIPTPPCHEDYYNDEDDEYYDDYDDDDDNHDDDEEEYKQEILHDEEEQLEILQDDFDDDDDENHEDGDDDEHEEEEEQLEILPDDPYYYVDDEDEEPLEEYYKPKMIWRGQDGETKHKSTRSFYSLSEGMVYRDFQLPVPYYKNCRGSSHGWLVTVDEEEQPDGITYTYPVRLLNPFRSVNNEIQLPSLTTIPDDECETTSSFYLHKAFLSANPSSLSNPSDLIVFGVYAGNRLGFCSPGDSAWTLFPLENKFRPIEDLICYKGRFLAIIQNGSVLELEFAPEPRPPSVKFVARTPANADNLTQKYLVESAGDLLQVHRDVFLEDGDDNCSTIGFRLFKLLLDDDAAYDDDAKWVEMDNLDGRMLFLGDNNSISLSATDFPGCMPDCIYFTDDNYGYYDAGSGATDFGIFNFVDKSFARFCPMRNGIMPQPIWIQPML